MEKIKYSGTVDTFYFIPCFDTKVAVLYLNVVSKQKYPHGKEEVIIPAKRMRFMLQERELGVLAKEKTVVSGDNMEVYATEDCFGKISYMVKIT